MLKKKSNCTCMQRNVKSETAKMKDVDVIESTERCGPCFFRNDLIDSQPFIFCTLFNRK